MGKKPQAPSEAVGKKPQAPAEAASPVDARATFDAAADAASACQRARFCLGEVRERVLRDVVMERGYRQLVKFMVTTGLLLLALLAQHGFNDRKTKIHTAVEGRLYGATESVLDRNSDGPADLVSDSDAIVQYIKGEMDLIFTKEICGDGVCQTPDEQPAWAAADDARTFQQSCASDCGAAPVRGVRVDFFDVAKLWAADQHLRTAWSKGWNGKDRSVWPDAALPVAGWNVCGKTGENLHEFGTPEEVCVFDGDVARSARGRAPSVKPSRRRHYAADAAAPSRHAGAPSTLMPGRRRVNTKEPSTRMRVPNARRFDRAQVTIGGRPYVSRGLDPTQQDFGGAFDVDLFDAAWEVRVAFANFDWGASEGGIVGPKAHPAVRGQICLESGADENGNRLYEACTKWAPCEAMGADCACEFVDSNYVCYEETSFNRWRDIYATYSESTGLHALARWWGVKNSTKPTTFSDVEDAAAPEMLDDDQWAALDADLNYYYLILSGHAEDSNPHQKRREPGWENARLTVTDLNTGKNESYAATGAVSIFSMTLRTTGSYRLEVGNDCYPADVSWCLADATGSELVCGGACVDCALPLDGDETAAAACAGDCASWAPLNCGGARRLAAFGNGANDASANARRLAAFGNDANDASANARRLTAFGNGADVTDASANAAFSTPTQACGWPTVSRGVRIEPSSRRRASKVRRAIRFGSTGRGRRVRRRQQQRLVRLGRRRLLRRHVRAAGRHGPRLSERRARPLHGRLAVRFARRRRVSRH